MASMPTDCNGATCPEISLPVALPGEPFETPPTAMLLGISLDDPLGDWPLSRQNVEGGLLPQTNGARWADHDSDGAGALTLYAVPPGGPGSLSVEAAVNYTATSDVCPRAGGTPLDYAFWPGLDGLTIRRVVRFHAASRVVSGLSGEIKSCDQIEGAVTGPNNGQLLANARFHGCMRCDTTEDANCPLLPCEEPIIDFLDGQDQSLQRVDSASFVIKRIASDSTCADVRAMAFP